MSQTLTRTIHRYYTFNFLRDLFFLSAVLVPFFTEWGGITLFQMQLLQSWFMFWVFVLEIPTGAVADYLGRKYSLSLGALASMAGALLYGSIARFDMFLVSEFLFALGMALTSGADHAFIYDALKDHGEESKALDIFGKAHAWKLTGIFISAPLGGLLAAWGGLNIPMLFTAFPLCLASLTALSFHEPRTHQETQESARYLKVIAQGFAFFAQHRILKLLALDVIMVASAGYFVIWYYQPLLQRAHVPIAYFGIVHMILTSAEILIMRYASSLLTLFRHERQFYLWSSLLVAIPFALVALVPSLPTILLFIVCAGGFGLTRSEFVASFMNRFIPSDQRATVISSISMFRRFALVILNPAIGLLATHSLNAALLVVSALPLSLFFFSPLLKQKSINSSLQNVPSGTVKL
ncbi:MAG: MFS transporter [Patescibacteria group bacterium]